MCYKGNAFLMAVTIVRNFNSYRNTRCIQTPVSGAFYAAFCKCNLTRAHMQIKAINSLWWSETLQRKQCVPLPWKPLSPRRGERAGKTQRANETGREAQKHSNRRQIDISFVGTSAFPGKARAGGVFDGRSVAGGRGFQALLAFCCSWLRRNSTGAPDLFSFEAKSHIKAQTFVSIYLRNEFLPVDQLVCYAAGTTNVVMCASRVSVYANTKDHHGNLVMWHQQGFLKKQFRYAL